MISLLCSGIRQSSGCCHTVGRTSFFFLKQSGYAKVAREPKAQESGKQGPTGDSSVSRLVKALEYEDPGKIELSPEDGAELARRSKEFARLKMDEHRAWQTALNIKLRLKLAAIEALPPDLKEAALVEDMSPFPVDRPVFTLTPPKAGYAEDQKQEQEGRTGAKAKPKPKK